MATRDSASAFSATADPFERAWGMTRAEFDKRDHRKEWEEFAKREGIKPDPSNYLGVNWSEVG